MLKGFFNSRQFREKVLQIQSIEELTLLIIDLKEFLKSNNIDFIDYNSTNINIQLKPINNS